MSKRYIPTLTIAGSDSSGGAGIQADIKTMSALGCYAMSVITAVTAQNTCGVTGVEPISTNIIEAQLLAVLDDIPPKAIKTGMLYDSSVILTVSKVISESAKDISLVVDPVMVATSGDSLLQNEALDSLKNELLPLASLVTPNIPETEVLSGLKIDSMEQADEASAKILELGVKAVLIKGGHFHSDQAVDILYTTDGLREIFKADMIPSKNTHGTGCTLSSAITSFLAREYSLVDSIRLAKEYLTSAIDSGKDVQIGNGHGPVNHFHSPIKSIIL